MKFYTSKPSLALSRYVKFYWTIENCMPTGAEHIQRIVPNGLFELTFYLGDKPKSSDKNKSITENTIITGQLKEYFDIKVSGKLSLFSIYFQPHGLSMFLDIPLRELLNQTVPLIYLLKDTVEKLEEKLSEANLFTERVSIAEHFLLNHIRKSEKEYQQDRINDSIDLINHTKGMVNIEFLASRACLSRKQYERTFLDFIGTSPKQFLKIIRFQNAINQRAKDGSTTLTALAYKCGYYDQSHMTNDFISLSGVSPKQYFKDSEPYSDYFQD